MTTQQDMTTQRDDRWGGLKEDVDSNRILWYFFQKNRLFRSLLVGFRGRRWESVVARPL